MGQASTGTLVTQPLLSCSEATSKLLSWAQNRGGSLGFEVGQVQVCQPGPPLPVGLRELWEISGLTLITYETGVVVPTKLGECLRECVQHLADVYYA